jgi:hypothetical protein
MSLTPDEPQEGPDSTYVQDPLPPLELEFSPEEDLLRGGSRTESAGDDTFGQPLDFIRYRTLMAKVEELEHQLKERRQLHKLRKKHSSRLFGLTIVWIVVVWIVVLFQGFGQWFTPIFSGLEYIKFHLSDTVAVAFITSTTATVLGLYGIAAYWLFGKPKKEEAEPEKAEKKPT